MTIDEFMEKLQYRYGKPKNDAFEGDIIRYLEKVDPDLRLLYDIIIDNHEYESYPNRAKVRGLWEKHGSTKARSTTGDIIRHLKQMHETWDFFDARKIYTMCAAIAKKGASEFWEMEFMHRWDMVYYYWEKLKQEGKSDFAINRYCETVRQSILNNEYLEEYVEPEYSDDARLRKTVKVGSVMADLF